MMVGVNPRRLKALARDAPAMPAPIMMGGSISSSASRLLGKARFESVAFTPKALFFLNRQIQPPSALAVQNLRL